MVSPVLRTGIEHVAWKDSILQERAESKSPQLGTKAVPGKQNETKEEATGRNWKELQATKDRTKLGEENGRPRIKSLRPMTGANDAAVVREYENGEESHGVQEQREKTCDAKRRLPEDQKGAMEGSGDWRKELEDFAKLRKQRMDELKAITNKENMTWRNKGKGEKIACADKVIISTDKAKK